MKFFYCIFLILLNYSISLSQNSKFPTLKTEVWNGFEKEIFDFKGRTAWVKKPKTPKPGNPWVWRAYFPDWHTQVDSILLERGFHIVYINTNNMYGSPNAMQIWDDFHAYLVKNWSFLYKVALEGVSRGGLYVYNWAKRNPLKVSCIYAEAPVCDFKSWPLKNGNLVDWQELLRAYNFTNEQAMAYNDNPIDNLKGLAACNVPILHSISLEDRIVPNEENTFPLINNYIKFGGKASVWPMTKGKATLQGHHFTIENPERIADFIEQNTLPITSFLPSENFHKYGTMLKNSFAKFSKEKIGRIAFMGGSITESLGWRDKISQYLTEKFPETKFEFINAGIASTGSTPGAFRLEKDVLSKGKIDLLIEEAAVNDRTNGFSSTAQIRGMEGIVRHALMENPEMDIVFLHFVDPDKIKEYSNGKIPIEIYNHDKVAEHYNLGVLNLAKEVTDRINAGEFTWNDDFKDLHPSIFGQEVYFQSLKTFFNFCFENINEAYYPESAILPNVLDSFNYSNAKYLSVASAHNLKNWEILPSWKPSDKIATRKQFVNIPALVSTTVDAEFSLTFEGTAIGICINSGPDAGKLEYTIDGKKYEKQDLFTQWSSYLHLPWYIMLDDELKVQKHILKVKISKDKNPKSQGNACRIMYFLVN